MFKTARKSQQLSNLFHFFYSFKLIKIEIRTSKWKYKVSVTSKFSIGRLQLTNAIRKYQRNFLLTTMVSCDHQSKQTPLQSFQMCLCFNKKKLLFVFQKQLVLSFPFQNYLWQIVLNLCELATAWIAVFRLSNILITAHILHFSLSFTRRF